jgi:transient receptor potential cation channel subfamily C member 4
MGRDSVTLFGRVIGSMQFVTASDSWRNVNCRLLEYIADLWNIVDFISNSFYVAWISLRFTSWYTVHRDAKAGLMPWYPREEWSPFDPMLLSEGAFAAGMIFSFLKLVHIFSINPHLGYDLC